MNRDIPNQSHNLQSITCVVQIYYNIAGIRSAIPVTQGKKVASATRAATKRTLTPIGKTAARTTACRLSIGSVPDKGRAPRLSLPLNTQPVRLSDLQQPSRPSAEAILAARAQQAAGVSARAQPLMVPSPEALQHARAQQEEMNRLRDENIKAMLADTVNTCRASVMPKLLQVSAPGHWCHPENFKISTI